MDNQVFLNVIKTDSDILSWGTLENLMITFAIEGQLPEQRLDELIGDAQRSSTNYVLAVSFGRYKMTSLQRKRSKEGFGNLARIATVLNDPISRGVITAFGWLGLNIKSFSIDRIQDACANIAPPGCEASTVHHMLGQIRLKHLAVLGLEDTWGGK